MSEPIYNLHYRFADGSNSMLWYHKTMAEVADILKKWSKNWIIEPEQFKVQTPIDHDLFRECMCVTWFDEVFMMYFVLTPRRKEVNLFEMDGETEEDAGGEQSEEPGYSVGDGDSAQANGCVADRADL